MRYRDGIIEKNQRNDLFTYVSPAGIECEYLSHIFQAALAAWAALCLWKAIPVWSNTL
jgi:hypothetical protein